MKTFFCLKNQLFNSNNIYIQQLQNKTIKTYSFSTITSKTLFQRILLNKSSANNANNNLLKFQTKKFCDWERVEIPFDKIEINFCRSSGPGGQNVNKLNSKVEFRFNIDAADWLTKETKERLKKLNSNKINNEGFFILTCQEYRTQSQNKKEAQKKLQEIINVASVPKKERIIVPFEETPQMEQKRIKEKKMRSDVKNMRNNHRDI